MLSILIDDHQEVSTMINDTILCDTLCIQDSTDAFFKQLVPTKWNRNLRSIIPTVPLSRHRHRDDTCCI